jgi:hypothetical protein
MSSERSNEEYRLEEEEFASREALFLLENPEEETYFFLNAMLNSGNL